MSTYTLNANSSPAQRRETITVRLGKARQDLIKTAARNSGMTIQEYITDAIKDRLVADGYLRPLIGHTSPENGRAVHPDWGDPFIPYSDQEDISPEDEAHIIAIMKAKQIEIPTIGQFMQMSAAQQMRTILRLLVERKRAHERLMVRQYVEEMIG